MDPDRDKDGFLTYMPAHWEEFITQAAEETKLNVFVVDENDQVAVHTTETCSLTVFWTRFRELRDE